MKSNLFLIEPYDITSIDSGGKQRIFHTIKELSKRFNVKTRYLLPKQKHHFSFLKCGIPYWFSDWNYKETIGASLKHKTETIVVEFSQLLYLAEYLPKESKITFVTHDISTISFWRRLQVENNLIKKLVHFFRWIEIYLYERKYLPKYDRVVAVSNHDAKMLKKLFNLKKVDVIENGIDKVEFLPKRNQGGNINIGFIGSTSHPPNLQAVRFLIDRISPELTKQNIRHQIVLAGSNDITGKNIHNLGRINNIKDFYAQIDILVAPIFSGSGSRIKILESLSYGRPVITTKIGVEGIEIKNDYLTVVNAEPKSWSKTIQELIVAPPIQTQPLQTELEKLTWENLFKKF